MIKQSLICYPGPGCTAVQSLHVEVQPLPAGGLGLRYRINADLARIRIPAPRPSAAVDGLWEHTCFEAFIAVEGESDYLEFNFSPSGQWAAYGFSGYRVRNAWTASRVPSINLAEDKGRLVLDAVIPAADLPRNLAGRPLQMGLTAVIESDDGGRSYWALHHPSDRPDFHHRAGFACILPHLAHPLQLS